MAALTPSQTIATNLVGKYKLILCSVTIGSTSDTIVLTEKSVGALSLAGVVGWAITGGLDAAFSYLQVSVSSLTITIASFGQAGTVATDFTGTTVDVTVLGKLSGV